MSKQTVVEWLMEQITYKTDDGEIRNAFTDTVDLSEYFNQAMEMDKEQKIDAWIEATPRNIPKYEAITRERAEEYYNKTFKNS